MEFSGSMENQSKVSPFNKVEKILHKMASLIWFMIIPIFLFEQVESSYLLKIDILQLQGREVSTMPIVNGSISIISIVVMDIGYDHCQFHCSPKPYGQVYLSIVCSVQVELSLKAKDSYHPNLVAWLHSLGARLLTLSHIYNMHFIHSLKFLIISLESKWSSEVSSRTTLFVMFLVVNM